MFVLLFVLASALTTMSLGRTVYTDTVAYTRLADTMQNILTADSGVEDAVYRLRQDMDISGSETLALFSATTTTLITGDVEETTVAASATTTNRVRKRTAVLSAGGVGVAFNYGVQVGEGGITMSNSASVDGNVYSNGPLVGNNSMIIYGSAVSAGAGGVIDDVEVAGDAYAHTITDSEIGGNAHYQTLANSTVGGISYASSPDQPPVSLPLTDAMIDELKADAAAGGTVTCQSYVINSETVALGPVKIHCDLTISGSAEVTLEGAVWVAGSITIENTAQVKLSSSLGGRSVAIIADNESDRLGSSRITVKNTTRFIGDAAAGAYIVLISQNNSSETGGSAKAITINNNNAAGDVVLYAGHGEIEIANQSELVEVTAYKIRASNSAKVIYSEGLASTLFSSGPGGGYEILSWDDM